MVLGSGNKTIVGVHSFPLNVHLHMLEVLEPSVSLDPGSWDPLGVLVQPPDGHGDLKVKCCIISGPKGHSYSVVYHQGHDRSFSAPGEICRKLEFDGVSSQSKSGDNEEVAWMWQLYCAAAIQHLHRINFSKEGSSSTIGI